MGVVQQKVHVSGRLREQCLLCLELLHHLIILAKAAVKHAQMGVITRWRGTVGGLDLLQVGFQGLDLRLLGLTVEVLVHLGLIAFPLIERIDLWGTARQQDTTDYHCRNVT